MGAISVSGCCDNKLQQAQAAKVEPTTTLQGYKKVLGNGNANRPQKIKVPLTVEQQENASKGDASIKEVEYVLGGRKKGAFLGMQPANNQGQTPHQIFAHAQTLSSEEGTPVQIDKIASFAHPCESKVKTSKEFIDHFSFKEGISEQESKEQTSHCKSFGGSTFRACEEVKETSPEGQEDLDQMNKEICFCDNGKQNFPQTPAINKRATNPNNISHEAGSLLKTPDIKNNGRKKC